MSEPRSRLFALNKLCPECAQIIAYRKAHPEIEIANPGSVLLDTRQLSALLKHQSHLDILWLGRTMSVVS